MIQLSLPAKSKTAAAAVVLLACAWSVNYKLELGGPIITVAAAAAALYGYRRAQSHAAPVRAQVWCGIYTVLVSLAIVAGRDVHYIGARGTAEENYLDWGLDSLAASLALAVLLYPALLALYRFTVRRPLGAAERRPPCRRVLLIMWALIFVCWTPYLLTFYPAGIVGDGALDAGGSPGPRRAVRQPLGGAGHFDPAVFPVAGVADLEADPHVGRVSCTLLAQSLLLARAVCAAVGYTGCGAWAHPRWAAWGSAAMYALSGFFASYGMVLWKDTLFSAAVVWLALQLWELKENGPDWKWCVRFSLTALFLCFWRNNGLYVLVLCLAAVAVLLRRKSVRLLACGLAVAVFTVVVTGPVYDALHIRKDSISESLSIPLQQIAATIVSGAELTEEQQEFLYGLLPREEWIASYHPSLSDDLKGNDLLDTQQLEARFGEFLKVWAQLLPANFGTYVEAYLMQTLGFWQPGAFLGNYNDYWIGVQDVADRGWHLSDWIYFLIGYSPAQTLQRNTRFVASGTAVWLMILAAVLILAQGRDRRRLLILAPFAASWAVLMLAVPIAYSYRYIFMLAVGFPLVCVLPFCSTRTSSPVPSNRKETCI